MASGIFKLFKSSIQKLGSVEPQWLSSEKEPDFETVEVGGSGPEMVLLHGLFGALSNWQSTQPLMAKYTTPVALKFPLLKGHKSEVKVKSLAILTEYFIRQRSIAPAILCGNSMGGHVALRLCLAHPELVDCMILAGSSGLYEHSVEALPVRPDRSFVKAHMDEVFYQKQFVTEEAVDEIAKILEERSNVLNLIHAARSAKKDNLKDLLPQINCPTLLLWGEDDKVTTIEVAEQFNSLIPNSILVTHKKCGHAPMIEYPEWFSEQVEKFLRAHSSHFKKKD